MTDTTDDSVVRDHGITRNFSVDEFDPSAHDSQRHVIQVRFPHRPHRPGRHHKHRHGHKHSSTNHTMSNGVPKSPTEHIESIITGLPASLSPSEQIQQLIGESEEKHDVFCQMDTLYKAHNEMQWREAARWVKYEEDVEEGGERWSKPHVASLSLHSLFELRSSLLMGAVMLDMDAFHISQVADLVLDQLINAKLLEANLRDQVRAAIIANHAHQHQKRRRSLMPTEGESMADFRKRSMKRNFSSQMSFRRGDSSSKLARNPNSVPSDLGMANGDIPESASSAKLNQNFLKKIPEGAEVANIMVGELDCLKYQITAFVRLTEARSIGDLTEVPLPTRFVFIMLGPPGSHNKNVEIGRSISTIMVDEVHKKIGKGMHN